MDAVQFGRWLSSRRHGWSSQRALAAAVSEEPWMDGCDISEEFLARLKAGHLVHPFRGAVRQRVLALAALVCTTPRDVRTYLRAAELTALSGEEAEYLQRLHAHLQALQAEPILLLPPRPALRFTVVDNSDFSPTGLTARETLLILASQEALPASHFQQRGF
jgi:hypothetical protein